MYNNGKGIPVVMHREEKVYVPTLIFGHLLTSSNYNDDERKVTGGRNGYGAKLCNIFSEKFIVETGSKENKLQFKQVWESNMQKTTEPILTPLKGEEFTKITFYPDLAKFKMDKLDRDFVGLVTRRAYDLTGTSKGVKVYLNGKQLPTKSFKDYIELYLKDKEDETGQPIKYIYENSGERWEVGVTLSDKGFQQVSFVNSIATTKGGRHVDYIADMVINKLIDAVKKKNKQGIQIKPFQIRTHLWLFVNCLIENPTFDSQTKENMTLQPKSFGSKCTLTEKFFANVLKIGVVESVLSWMTFKAQAQLANKCAGKKTTKIKNLPKLDDANDAGTRNSIDCTLILTEGDSAKTLVIAGLGVVGRDKYGCFPLKGKILNVREATHKQILENDEINNIIKIMGLQYKKKYDSIDDLKTLRYGRLMIMTDQDQDGSHIKGLLINFIHHNWPSLLKLPFLEEFITPIVKARRGNETLSFYSLPELEEWKQSTPNFHKWKLKYYKGLGTSSSDEAKEYFSNLNRNRIRFKYQGNDDDQSILLAFSKKMVDDRKVWLTNSMEDRKRRRELGLPEVYLYEKDTREVTYQDFVNKELVLFSNADNERSIPSIMDGLKPGQRKVLFTCFKRNDTREVKVAQLAGAVGEKAAYHHGEVSLMSTIVNLAQNFVGSNNIPLLRPIGQFGTRLQGGKDSASPRYIYTMLSPLTRRLFPSNDEPLLNYLFDDNLRIEPEFYAPIIPLVLVNGASGIGTGWSTQIPNFNPRDLANNVKRMIKGEEPVEMMPWFKGFRGQILSAGYQRYVSNGEVALLDNNRIEITELPIKTWTQTYKENVLEPLLNGSEKTPSVINDYKEYHTDATVRFVVTMNPANFEQARAAGFHKYFKLQTTFATSSMVLFDGKGVLRKFESPLDILKDFFEVRRDLYYRRKVYLEGILEAEARKLSNQARFILEKIDGKIKMENVKRKEFRKLLAKLGFDSDPIKAWKAKNNFTNDEEEPSQASQSNQDSNDNDEEDGQDYEYLLGMRISSLLYENAVELMKQRDAKRRELEELRQTKPETLWERELDSFLKELDTFEKKEVEATERALQVSKSHLNRGKSGKAKGGKFGTEETKPSPFGERVEPELVVEKKPNIKGRGKVKTEKGEEVLDDEDIPLAERIGTSPEIIDKVKKMASPKKLKQTKLNFPVVSRKEANSNSTHIPNGDDTIVENGNHLLTIDDDDSSPEKPPLKASTKVTKPKGAKEPKAAKASKASKEPKAKKAPAKKAAAKKTFDVDTDTESDASDVAFKPDQGKSGKNVEVPPVRAAARAKKPSRYVFSSDEEDSDEEFTVKKTKGAQKPEILDVESSFEDRQNKRTSEDMYDQLFKKQKN